MFLLQLTCSVQSVQYVGPFRYLYARKQINHAQSLTASQLIPQIIINHRRHSTEGLQPVMMLLWASAGVPLGVYNIVENFNVALRIQPQILTLLSLLTWSQCCYYGRVGFLLYFSTFEIVAHVWISHGPSVDVSRLLLQLPYLWVVFKPG